MFRKMFSTMTHQSAKHLRGYNPFVEFKSDINRTLDKHIQMNNTIIDRMMATMMAGFGALGGGIVILYQKTEVDKKELDHKIDTNKVELDKRIDHLDKRMEHLEHRMDHIDQKLDEVLALMTAPKKWF
jgi:uncharacterized protein YlxW (UPF0749 family)